MNPIRKTENLEVDQNTPTQEFFKMLTRIEDLDQIKSIFPQAVADAVGKSKRD